LSKVISDYDEFFPATGLLERAEYFEDVVLRLQAAHHEVIAVLSKVSLRE
jgi:hypothetical protein